MKCYKQIVYSCAECPECHCGLDTCMIEEKYIEDITKIPGWCPLDDY